MVFEQIFKVQWMEKKEHSFFLGLIYTFIGFTSAYLILPGFVGIMSIAFTSIMLVPSLNQLLSIEENIRIRAKRFDLIELFKDHKDIIKVYLTLFAGIFTAYLMMGLIFPKEASNIIFNPQLLLTGIVGRATGGDFFTKIVTNNLLVFIVCFILSFFYGAGSILFLTVNASAWGVYFGYVMREIINTSTGNRITDFFSYILPILPHTLTEALSYISAAIAGGVVSKAVLREKPFSKEFNHIIIDSLIILGIGIIIVIIAGIIETIAYNKI